MDTALLLMQQVLIMYLLAAIAFVAYRAGKITDEGSKTIGNLLIYVSLPSVIIKGFLVERSAEQVMGLFVSMALAAVILASCILISRLCFPKDEIASFGAAFSNPGFFGIPLITAILGNEAVFYVAPYIAFLNLLQWSYGVSLLTGKKTGLKLKSVVTAPFMIAIAIGLVLFLTGLELPPVLMKTLDFCAGFNTPLAMFTVGVYMTKCHVGEMLKKKSLYMVSAVRLLLIPVAALAILTVIPWVGTDMRTAILIAAACPVGSNLAVYAQLHDKNYAYAVETVVASTMFCILTIPAIVYVSGLLWG